MYTIHIITGILDERKSHLKSSVVHHNINPAWKDKLLIRMITSDYIGLRQNAHIFFTVWVRGSILCAVYCVYTEILYTYKIG